MTNHWKIFDLMVFVWTYEWHCWAEPDRMSVLEKQSMIPNVKELHAPDEKSKGNSPTLVNAQSVTLAIWNNILLLRSIIFRVFQLSRCIFQSEFQNPKRHNYFRSKFTCRLTNCPPKTYISPFIVAEQESTVLMPSPLPLTSHSYGP